MAAMMMVATAAPAFAAPPDCDAKPNGCKTQTTTELVTVDDPTKNNPKFFSVDEVTIEESQRGNFNKGTISTHDEDELSRVQKSCQNPSGKPNGPTCD
jgi:hypothetical protein